MDIKNLRKTNRIFFALNVVLEGAAIGVTVFAFFFHCVKGNEVSSFVMIFLYFIFSAFLPDLLYLLLTLKLATLGIDPLAVMFNFFEGALCIVIAFALFCVMLFFCGGLAQLLLICGGALTLLSGIIHLVNALMCQKQLPASEAYYPKRRSISKQAKKNAKQDKKKAKADKKAAAKEAKSKGKEKGKGKDVEKGKDKGKDKDKDKGKDKGKDMGKEKDKGKGKGKDAKATAPAAV